METDLIFDWKQTATEPDQIRPDGTDGTLKFVLSQVGLREQNHGQIRLDRRILNRSVQIGMPGLKQVKLIFDKT